MAEPTLTEVARRAITDFDSIKNAIEYKGVSVPTTTPTSTYGTLIRSISGGSSITTSWLPDPLWWDYKVITDNELNSIPGYQPAAFILLQDNDLSTVLSNAGTGTNVIYKTSDGYQGASYTHIWDRSKDKESSVNHKTRYIIVFTPDSSPNITLGTSATAASNPLNILNPLGIYCKYRYISAIYIGNTASGDYGNNCEFLDFDAPCPATLLNVTFWGSSLRRLKFINLPKNLTILGTSFADSWHSFNQSMVGQFPNVTTVGNLFATGWVTHNQSIDGLFPSVTSLGSGAFTNWYSFNNILVIPYTTTTLQLPTLTANLRLRGIKVTTASWSANSWNISYSPLWTTDTIVDFFTNLPSNVGNTAKTIILGATNLNKVNATQKAIATNKNYILQ